MPLTYLEPNNQWDFREMGFLRYFYSISFISHVDMCSLPGLFFIIIFTQVQVQKWFIDHKCGTDGNLRAP